MTGAIKTLGEAAPQEFQGYGAVIKSALTLRNLIMSKDILVIGGGIAGIQSALDLADMGIKVHLVERLPSIGGKMAQLDKTFPTNDCAI